MAPHLARRPVQSGLGRSWSRQPGHPVMASPSPSKQHPASKTALTTDQPMSRVASSHRRLLAHVRGREAAESGEHGDQLGSVGCLARRQPARRQARRSGKEVVASLPARSAHPRQGPPRVPEHPPDASRTGAAPKPGKPGPGRAFPLVLIPFAIFMIAPNKRQARATSFCRTSPNSSTRRPLVRTDTIST